MGNGVQDKQSTLKNHSAESFRLISVAVIILSLTCLVFEYKQTTFLIARSAAIVSALFAVFILSLSFGKKNSIVLIHLFSALIQITFAFVLFRIQNRYMSEVTAASVFVLLMGFNRKWGVINQLTLVIYSTVILFISVVAGNNQLLNIAGHFDVAALFAGSSLASVLISIMNAKITAQHDEIMVDPNINKAEPAKDSGNENTYKDIVDFFPEGIFRSTIEGKIIYANDSLVKILGYRDIEELIKLDISKKIYADEEERKKLIKIILAQGKVKNYRIRFKRKDQSSIIVRVSSRIVKDAADNPLYIEGIIQDITQQVKIEEERKREIEELRIEKKKAVKDVNSAVYTSNIKAQFLASMSHEIKTPINSIVGFLTLIEKGMFESEGELKDFASNAKTAADSLLDIINNVLDISKIEAGKMELDDSEFEIRNEIEKAKSIIIPTANEKKLNLNFIIDEEIPEKVFGDPTRYRQIILNILSNAVKYTDKGEIRFKLDLIKQTEATVKLKATIIDTGRGIPAEKLPLLFKPYTQLKSKKWTQKDGAGLGLMISKEFAQLMGGTIVIDSEEGIGTTVEFTAILKTREGFLSRKKEEKAAPQEENPVEPVPEKKLPISYGDEELLEKVNLDEIETGLPDEAITKPGSNRKRILLVEDNPISQKVEKKLLSDSGYEVEAVSSALDAIEAVRTNSFDLVLMDVEMPDMDGLTATQKIRSLDAPASQIPVIAVTAHSSMKDREKCLAAGMDDYIAKPININFMRMTIEQWLYRASF
ncbi:MAG: response regulator [Melioribacteraceae bacterium]|nr:response regulator [Melioribacteraceae bacterium]